MPRLASLVLLLLLLLFSICPKPCLCLFFIFLLMIGDNTHKRFIPFTREIKVLRARCSVTCQRCIAIPNSQQSKTPTAESTIQLALKREISVPLFEGKAAIELLDNHRTLMNTRRCKLETFPNAWEGYIFCILSWLWTMNCRKIHGPNSKGKSRIKNLNYVAKTNAESIFQYT